MNPELLSEVFPRLTYQSYAPAPAIEGVTWRALKKHRSLEGSFMEHLRVTDGRAEGLERPFEVRQTGVSWSLPWRINAFHIHPKAPQDELWCALQGMFLVWLVDLRQDSPTAGNRRAYLLSGEEPGLLYIPTGVAHGYQAGAKGGMLLYVMSHQFDPADPNEGRLPWDMFGAELWTADRGAG